MSFDSAKSPADELDLLVGSTVGGKYHIERLIGRGGMGAVFQATHAAIGKRVALKFLSARAGSGEAAARFQREAEAASLAESPHIVQIFDSGRSEQGLPFLVMELLAGEDLRARLCREKRIGVESALSISVQVLKALREAHAAGIVHRDLKPENVFLCRRGDEPSFVKIVDFGISKLQQHTGADRITHRGAVLGTAAYMSPEQAQSFSDIDGRTDLFSLGAILYEMLVGQPPHSAPSYEAVLVAVCTRDAPDVRRRAPDVPTPLAQVIARALRRDRDERYASASEMLADLEAIEQTMRNLAPRQRSTAPAWPGGVAPPDRYRTLVFSLVAALGGFSLAAYFVVRDPSAAPKSEPAKSPAPATLHPPPSSLTVAEPPAPSSAPGPQARPAGAQPRRTTGLDAPKPGRKRLAPAASAGVAGGLELSTREP